MDHGPSLQTLAEQACAACGAVVAAVLNRQGPG